MPSPFPGMDPYLEQSAYWAAFHSRLIVALADAIEPPSVLTITLKLKLVPIAAMAMTIAS